MEDQGGLPKDLVLNRNCSFLHPIHLIVIRKMLSPTPIMEVRFKASGSPTKKGKILYKTVCHRFGKEACPYKCDTFGSWFFILTPVVGGRKLKPHSHNLKCVE